jgi:hypothetical protein
VALRDSRERRRYRRTNAALAALAAVYLIVAVSRKALKREEWFPIASWALFSTVPNENNDYGLRLMQIDGRKLDPPLPFERAEQFFWSAKKSTARGMIQALGASIARHDMAQSEALRQSFEPLHLRGHKQVIYQVVARQYDPLERWHGGGFDRIRPLATYQLNQPGEVR